MNLRKVLGVPSTGTELSDKMIVAEYKNSKIGILIDRASEIIRLPEDYIENTPELFNEGKNSDYIHKIAKLNNNTRRVLLLNLPKILDLI